jgi:hypothetical protein
MIDVIASDIQSHYTVRRKACGQTERQRIRNQIDAAMISARADFVNVCRRLWLYLAATFESIGAEKRFWREPA